MSMRTTQIMVAKGFGGAERYFLDLSLALAEAGHPVQAICHPRFPQRATLEAHPGIRVNAVNVAGSWDPWARWQITRRLRDFSPTLVHAHLARAAHFAGHAGRRLGIPVTVKTHNYVDLKYYRGVATFITTTRDQRDYLVRQGIDSSRIEVIPNFSSQPAVAVAHPPPASGMVFASYGRLVAKKGFADLLRALADLRRRGLGVRLVLGGTGPEEAALRHLAAELDLGDALELAGWVQDTAGFLAQADAFVLPSLDEPFGIAVLEAMASGRPLVATRTKGPLEILDEDTAVLVPPGDPAALASAMAATAADPAAAARRATAALERFRTHYAREAVVPRILAHYEATVTGR